MRKYFSIDLVCLALGIASSSIYGATATQSGDWSSGATWGGSAPSGDEEDITIPAGTLSYCQTQLPPPKIGCSAAIAVKGFDQN